MSADLFAAFGDSSSLEQQSRPKHNPTKSVLTAAPFAPSSAFKSFAPNPSQQQWGQSSGPSLHQYQHSWQTGQSSPALPTKPSFVTSSAFQSLGSRDTGDSDDDGWGDFEVAPNNVPLPVSVPAAPEARKQVVPEPPIIAQNTRLQRTRIVRASTLDLVSNSLVDFREVSPQPPQSTGSRFPVVDLRPGSAVPEAKAEKEKKKDDPNVLFDADDFDGEQDAEEFDDDTDFGEFETVSPPSHPTAGALSTAAPNKVERASNLLLELDLNHPSPASCTQTTETLPKNSTQRHLGAQNVDSGRPKPPLKIGQPRGNGVRTEPQSFDEDWTLSDTLPKKPAPASTKSIETSWDWEPIEEPGSSQPPTSIRKATKPPGDSDTTNNGDASWDWGEVEADSENVAESKDAGLPPINIPPPSILMSIFPQLFNEANEQLYKPISGQRPTIKARILSDPKVYEFLRGYLTLAIVAARIVAGRKMRWHRDNYLAQSMSISAAGSKGMKLAGVDKMQAAREAREADDVVSTWKGQAGRLKSTVASVNAAMKNNGKGLSVPEITDTIQVQTAKGVPTATKPCAICGLERNERLAKIDHDVEDSFGEWWADHWGHIACKRFWLQHEKTLRQR